MTAWLAIRPLRLGLDVQPGPGKGRWAIASRVALAAAQDDGGVGVIHRSPQDGAMRWAPLWTHARAPLMPRPNVGIKGGVVGHERPGKCTCGRSLKRLEEMDAGREGQDISGLGRKPGRLDRQVRSAKRRPPPPSGVRRGLPSQVDEG